MPEQPTKPAPWLHFVAGGLGAMSGAVITGPLDVVKTRLQSSEYRPQQTLSSSTPSSLSPSTPSSLSPSSLPSSSSLAARPLNISLWRPISETGHMLQRIYYKEGLRALWKGLGANLVGVVPARAINFYTYGNGKLLIADLFNNGEENSMIHLSAAMTTGIFTATATNPIWVVKTRMQLQSSPSETITEIKYRNSIDCMKKIIKHEGIRGLYRGLSASYLGVTEGTIQWVLYERLKRSVKDDNSLSSWSGKLGAAGGAKLLAALITYPHEVVRTRLRQTPSNEGILKYTGLIQTFKLVWKEEGLVAMYGGLTAHLLRVVPNAAIMFFCYELVLSMGRKEKW